MAPTITTTPVILQPPGPSTTEIEPDSETPSNPKQPQTQTPIKPDTPTTATAVAVAIATPKPPDPPPSSDADIIHIPSYSRMSQLTIYLFLFCGYIIYVINYFRFLNFD